MLPNGGYFRSITCPYFESGSCERVYCHFRHKKKTDVNYIPTPLAELRKVVTPDTTTNAADLVPEYCPTPLDQLAQMNYSYANQAPERDRDSPDFECKSLLQTRPATALSDTVDAKTAASGDQGPVLVDTIEDDVGIVSNGQTKRRRLESDSNVTNKKSQTEIDREIEQSMKTKKKQASGSRLISEQEQQLNANIKKARVAHKGPDNASAVMSELLSRKSMKLTPAQIMFNRFLTVQSGPEEKAEESVAPVVETTKATPSKALTNENASKKKRIAHTLKASSSSSIVIKKPMVFPEIGSKVPTNLRQRYLDLFVEECLKLDSNKQKAYDRAMSEEKGVYKRSQTKNIYLNLAVNTVKRIRNEQKKPTTN